MNHSTRIAGCLLALSLTVATGCSKKSGADAFLPDQDVARKALDTALAAWQSGQKLGPLEAEGRKISVEDFQWRSGVKLQAYEVLEGGENASGARQFRVKLTCAGIKAPITTEYFVIGRDPLFVARDKDFARMGEM